MRQEREGPAPVHRILHRWFVRYNPLYFFSALCVLAGVFLVSTSPEADSDGMRLLLAGVTQIYELLLLGAAAFLFRLAGLRRPAVILAIVSLPFLFDWTLQLEAASTFHHYGVLASTLWVALVPAKILLIAWIFRLRPHPLLVTLPTVASAAMATAPHLMGLSGFDPNTVLLVAVWFGAILSGIALRFRPGLSPMNRLDRWGLTVLRRAIRGGWILLVGLSVAHAGAWIVQFHLTPSPILAAPLLLLLPFLHRREGLAWAGAAAAVGVTLFQPTLVPPTAALAGLTLLWHGYDLHRPRLYVASSLALFAALWTIELNGIGMPPPDLILSLASAAFLLVMAWTLRVKTAVPAAGLVLLPCADALIPASALQWGMTSLAAGFLALLIGVMVSWRLRIHPPPDSDPETDQRSRDATIA